MIEIFKAAREASYILMAQDSQIKDEVLKITANKLDEKREFIKKENEKDLEWGRENGLSDAMMNRLLLDDKTIDSMIQAVNEIIAQTDPVGSVVEGYKRPNGLQINKVRVPIGVVGIIYESRPNVTIDAAALCLKSGNVSILRGGKEAVHSNKVLGNIMKEALKEGGLPDACVNIIEDPDRNKMNEMLKAKDYIDIMVPRGGEGLIRYCTEHSLIPLVKHDKGVCHVYIDKDADPEKAIAIAMNAKVSRPGVCNAIESLIVHEAIAGCFLPELLKAYGDAGVEIRGCKVTQKIVNCKAATEEDWDTEYLDLIISVKTVAEMADAIEHINKHGSQHSDAIVTENYTSATEFMKKVDSAAVFVNASTRFSDGGQFGLGAEIGISTQKLHCRGPMGAFDLTTTKYMVYGDGHVRK